MLAKKGYLSFVIVFVFVLASLSLLYILYASHSYNIDESKPMISETVYAHLLDIKHASVSVTKAGTYAVIATEVEAILSSEGADALIDAIDPDKLREEIKTAVCTNLGALDAQGMPDGFSMTMGYLPMPFNSALCMEQTHVLLAVNPKEISADVSFDKLGFKYCYKGMCDTGYLPSSMKIHTGYSLDDNH